jgi:hypothetical protein
LRIHKEKRKGPQLRVAAFFASSKKILTAEVAKKGRRGRRAKRAAKGSEQKGRNFGLRLFLLRAKRF